MHAGVELQRQSGVPTTLDTGRHLHVAGDVVVTPGSTLLVSDDGTLQGRHLTLATGGVVDHAGTAPMALSGTVHTAIGSALRLGADTTLGDAAAVNSVVIAGELEVRDNVVTLQDANDVVFDSGALVTIGAGPGAPGQIIAANGVTLDFGGNITGNGILRTADDVTRPTINNGHIAGESMADPLTLTGYIKGVGTCDNCVITGTDAPGFSPATVVRGSMSYQGVVELEVGGLADGESDRIDHLLGAGQVELGGELLVTLIDGFTFEAGDSLVLMSAAGGITGTFATETLPVLGGGLALDVLYGAHQVSLGALGLPGDYNYDGQVDLVDFILWRESLGAEGVGLAADGNGDTVVDAADYGIWKSNFGLTISAAVESQPVPEPAGAIPLAMLLGMSLGLRLPNRHLTTRSSGWAMKS